MPSQAVQWLRGVAGRRGCRSSKRVPAMLRGVPGFPPIRDSFAENEPPKAKDILGEVSVKVGYHLKVAYSDLYTGKRHSSTRSQFALDCLICLAPQMLTKCSSGQRV